MSNLDEEAEELDNGLNVAIMSAARKIIAGSLEGMPKLIVDLDKKEVRWPEAWEIFKARLPTYSTFDDQTAMMYATSDALEALSDSLTFERLDESIHKASLTMKLAIIMIG